MMLTRNPKDAAQGSTHPAQVGVMLKKWRQHRRMSQLELALEVGLSPRHLSFLETGRSLPGRDMVLRLAERLDVPLRERNALLLAAGFAPTFMEQPLTAAALAAARRAMEHILTAHEPYPALMIDRHWNMMAANRAVAPLLADIANRALLEPPVNVVRLSLHPGGLAPRIVNLFTWRTHLLERLRHETEMTADPALAVLLEEMRSYPGTHRNIGPTLAAGELGGFAVPLQLRVAGAVLSLISTTTVFGTPLSVAVSELALETFFPADEATARALQHFTAKNQSATAIKEESGTQG